MHDPTLQCVYVLVTLVRQALAESADSEGIDEEIVKKKHCTLFCLLNCEFHRNKGLVFLGLSVVSAWSRSINYIILQQDPLLIPFLDERIVRRHTGPQTSSAGQRSGALLWKIFNISNLPLHLCEEKTEQLECVYVHVGAPGGRSPALWTSVGREVHLQVG